MIYDSLSNWQLYFPAAELSVIPAFISTVTNDTENKDYPIIGDDIFGRILSYKTRQPAEVMIESHKRYIDIQFVITGAEGISCQNSNFLDVLTPYDPDKDLVFYKPRYPLHAHAIITPGNFAVFFPHDAHMPQLACGNRHEHIKKGVIKLKMDYYLQFATCD